jgi:CrcB protein
MPGSLATLFSVALGGAAGALSRYAVTAALSGPTGRPGMPWGVLLVNLTGCLAAGLIGGALAARGGSDPLRLLLITGFLGSFTTYSAFGLDAYRLVEAGRWGVAGWYAAVTLVAGPALAWLGWSLSGRLGSGGLAG